LSDQEELNRLESSTSSIAPVLQNPKYLRVDPFPLINVPNTPSENPKTGASSSLFKQNTVINKDV